MNDELGIDPNHWSQTEEGKNILLDILNKEFYFHKDGSITKKEKTDSPPSNEPEPK